MAFRALQKARKLTLENMPERLAPSTRWIFNPAVDLICILLTPVPILLAFAAATRGGWPDALVAFVFSLAMAHYFPGILRAYADRELFLRFRTRLIVAPLFLITTTASLAYLDFKFMFLLVTLWGAWHWLMQVYGFARIYDAKSGARTSARVDQVLCILLFGFCMFVLSNAMPMYVTRFYESGGPRVSASIIEWLSRIWLALTIAFASFYIVWTIRNVRRGLSPNPLKLVFIAVTFAYLSYTVSRIDQPLLGYAMFESWHDVQYLAIVWMFNLNRARISPAAGRWIGFLFRPRAERLLVYLVLCLAFGSLTHAWRLLDNAAAARVALSLVMAAALLHYYLDGFIWKIRETQTQQALGVDSTSSVNAAPPLVPAWTRHAVLWLLFAVPACLLFVMEARSTATPVQIFQNLVDTFPRSAQAHYELGRSLQESGKAEEAKPHLLLAVTLNPGLLPARTLLGGLLASQGDLAEARSHLERVLKAEPQNAQAHNNLGIVYDREEDLTGARREFELAVQADPSYALAHNNLGIVLAKLGRAAEARAHYESALRIAPNFGDAHYQLGLALAAQGDWNGAAAHFEQSLRINPGEYLTYNSLGAVLASQGRLLEAKQRFEQALQLKPDFRDAQQNLLSAEMKLSGQK